jgi:hypothetical protein
VTSAYLGLVVLGWIAGVLLYGAIRTDQWLPAIVGWFAIIVWISLTHFVFGVP